MKLLRNKRFVICLKGIMIKYMYNMVSCKEFEGFILDYFDDEFSTAQKTTFEMHMRICSECRDYLQA
jgi:hypothetical protein